MIINGMLQQQAPLSATSHADKMGLSEPMPMPGAPSRMKASRSAMKGIQGAKGYPF